MAEKKNGTAKPNGAKKATAAPAIKGQGIRKETMQSNRQPLTRSW